MGRGRAAIAAEGAAEPPRRRKLASASLVALAVSLAFTPAAAAAPMLPDLVSDPPGDSMQLQIYSDAQGQRLLMRFDGWVHNRGTGALEIRASARSGSTMTSVVQRIFDSAGGYADLVNSPTPRVIFEPADGHNHWHLRNVMRYSLYTANRASQAAPSQKVGFCLVDSQIVEAPPGTPAVYKTSLNNFCGQNEPLVASTYMGISAGFRDYYNRMLAFQWIDVSDVAPGQYWLRADTDPDGVIKESNEVNSGSFAPNASVVNGYLANAVARGQVSAWGSSAINLSATKFDDMWPATPGALQFKIVTPPAHGTLNVTTGTWFSGTQVRYTPSFLYSGPDSFTYAARDGSSAFPRNARTAAVTLTVPGMFGANSASSTRTLGISGAPETVQTSSSTPLKASGPGSSDVAWSVDGMHGGNDRVGRVSPGGVYRAPSSPPPGGRVVVSAKSTSGAAGEVALRIVRAPA
ncbi:MAG: lysyl oxidase family protein, partial [Solirubrobacteraceae bacterium]